jgi:hypothetical protein
MIYKECCRECSNLEYFPFCIERCIILELYNEDPYLWKGNKEKEENDN